MKKCIVFLSLCFLTNLAIASSNFYKLKATTIEGDEIDFSQYKGKVVIIVNIASKCAFKGQLKKLEKLYKKYKTKGLEILAFPSNDFNQEPLDGEEIKDYCEINYGVSYTVFNKTHVKGENQHPVYKFLYEKTRKSVKWNYYKFLINKEGNVVDYNSNWSMPKQRKIEQLLNQ